MPVKECVHRFVVRHPELFGERIIFCETCNAAASYRVACTDHNYKVDLPDEGMWGNAIVYCENGGHLPLGTSCSTVLDNRHKFFVTFPHVNNWDRSPIIRCSNCGYSPEELTAIGESPYVNCNLKPDSDLGVKAAFLASWSDEWGTDEDYQKA